MTLPSQPTPEEDDDATARALEAELAKLREERRELEAELARLRPRVVRPRPSRENPKKT